MDQELRDRVRERAGHRCEYCRLRQSHSPLPKHQIEHIIPRKHKGTDDDVNLALACALCNLSKSSNLAGIDSITGEIVPLFNPRTEDWNDHFAFQGAWIVGLTPTGRATVDVLNMNNDPDRVQLRIELLLNGELD